jgi:hypothetical protein
MSREARWVLGAFALFFAVIFLIGASPPKTAQRAAYAGAAFCGLVFVACFSSRARPLVIRIIGGIVFFSYWAFLASVVSDRFASADPSTRSLAWIGALIGLYVYGLPGLYVAAKGQYPKWGIGADAFRGKETSSIKEDPPQKR